MAVGELDDAPRPTLCPWTLGGQFHHDADCFELNPVTWRTIARHGIALRGTPAAELMIPDDDDLLVRFVRENTATYWAPSADELRAVLESDPHRSEFDPAIAAWCVLGPARMLRTVATGDVVSKVTAGRWIVERHPHLAEVVNLALAVRDDADHPPVDRRVMLDVATFIDEVVALVDAT